MRHAVCPWAIVPAVFLCGAAAAQPKVEQKPLGPIVDDYEGHLISAPGHRLATIARKGEGAVIVVDGVESPVFSEVLDTSFLEVSLPPELNDPNVLRVLRDADNRRTRQRVLFSDDGARVAYAAVNGSDWVVFVDGKEFFRLPAGEYADICGMRFSPRGGKHLYFVLNPMRSGPGQGFRLVVDGKPSDQSYLQPFPVFTADGEHYACVFTDPADPEKHTLIVDGRPAPYKGVRPEFDANGRLFTVTIDPESAKETLQLDGKPWFTAYRVGVYPAPVGENVAATGDMGSQNVELFINGASVASAPQIDDVTWSPDGQRYAALCGTTQHTKYAILDGVNGPELQNITDIAFSPDSKRLVYIGFADGRHHVVFDNESVMEGAASMVVKPFFYGPRHEVAFVQAQAFNNMALVVGEQMFGGLTNVTGLTPSPDGTRVAFVHGNMNATSAVIGDMEYSGFTPASFQAAASGATETPKWFVFSPDGKHVARMVMSPEPRGPMGVMVDETLIQTKSTRISRPHFTPDSRHLFWVEAEKPHHVIYLDGEPVARYDLTSYTYWESTPDAWGMDPDGTFVLMGPVANQVTRLSITPSDATSIDTMIAKAK